MYQPVLQEVSEILSVAVIWLSGCRQGLQPNTSLSLLTTEVTADVSAQEILSVLSEIVFNTWAFQCMTQFRIVILQMFVPLGNTTQCCETTVMHPFFPWAKSLTDWRPGLKFAFRVKFPSKKNHFHQHVCGAEQKYEERWPCEVIAGEGSYF